MEGEDCNAGAELFLQRRVGEMIAILNGGWRSVPCRRGVTRREVGNAGRSRLKASPHLKAIVDPRRHSAKVTRIFNRCHAHGLIPKIPHSRRWRLTKQERIAMTASVLLRDVQFPITYMKLTA